MLILHILGHVIVLNGWQASLATLAIAFHDIVLYPIVFVVGRVTKRNKPKDTKAHKILNFLRKKEK